MNPDTEEIDFTAPDREPYLKMDSDAIYKLQFIDRAPDHDEFKCGKEDPAQVWRVRDLLTNKIHRLTVTSTHLRDGLKRAAEALGGIEGKTLKIEPEGEKKERKYRVRAVVEKGAQQRIG